MKPTILLVDDEPNYRLIIGRILDAQGYNVVEAGSGREALELFRESLEMDLVMTDITMPDGDGMELLSKIKEERSEVPVVMLTAHNDTRLAVKAIKNGAFDYLTKPYSNEDLLRCTAKALELSSVTKQNKELKAALSSRRSYSNIIGQSKPMTELFQLLSKVAPTKANVLITGESGTGKELVAKAIHLNSPRAEKAFVAVNCSALSETLLVSELFGYEKGAYTGAGSGRAGRFELANKGTLFLDEIGEIGSSTQVTLLRVLQERTLERVGGGGKMIELDVRLITATNLDLKAEVMNKRFREDLFFRLNVVNIKLPPLRERLDDLPLLVEHFLDKLNREKEERQIITPETMRLLYAYHWPGNVRELENVIERALVFSTGTEILPTDLPEELQRPASVLISPSAVSPADLLKGPAVSNGSDLLGQPGQSAGEAPESDPLSPADVNPAQNESQKSSENKAPADFAWPSVSPATANRASTTTTSAVSFAPTGMAVAGPATSNHGGTAFIYQVIDLIPQGVGLSESLLALEEAMLRKALGANDGVQSRAADLLGLKRNVFKYKWDKYV
ncbi:MAG: sigma 54-interacting transcriptional regulator, partial [Deltaproteobacteria bacterium]|nr:sigma 54-interacting transcriptional regulator [Deltaproteobacteria bacterium]